MRSIYGALLLFGMLCHAAVAAPGVQHLSQAMRNPYDKSNPISVKLNGTLLTGTARIYWYDGGLGGGRNLRCDYTFTNTGAAKAYYALNVAYFDAAGNMIASASRYEVFGKDPGKADHCELEAAVPKSEMPRVVSCQIVLYDDTQQIGKQ